MINDVSDKLFNELVDELIFRMSKGVAPAPQDPKYYLTMTDAGNQKLLSGHALTITECAVGDANDRYVTPESAVTALVHEFARVPIVSSTQTGEDIAIKSLINAQHGGHTIREFGLYDDQGVLIIYGNHPPTYIAHVGDPNLSDVVITATIKPVDASKITVNIADTPAQLYQKMVQTQTSISQIAQTVATDRQHSQDSATAAHRDAQAASQSESSVTTSKQRVEQLATQVEAAAKVVDGQSKSVAIKQTAVSSDHTDVMQAKAAVLSAKTNTMNAIASTFKDGGTWTPTAQKEYPDKPNPAHSTSWFVVLPKGQTYTFTSGDLQNDDHNIVEHGSMLYYSAVEDKFHGGGDGSLAVGEIVLPNGTKRGHSITITLADLGAWSGRGGFDGDVVLGEHALYANDGAIAIKDDTTHQGLQVGDASAAGQQTIIHSVGNVKAVFQGDRKVYDVLTSKDDILGFLVGFALPDSTVAPLRDMAFLADGAVYNRADYPKLWSKISGTSAVVPQSQINSAPKSNAAKYGDGDGSTTFTVPNYGLRPHLAAAGVFGAAGSTKEDHIQNMTGILVPHGFLEGTGISSQAGVFDGGIGNISPNKYREFLGSDAVGKDPLVNSVKHINFDASRIARTSNYTEVNSSFLNFYIIHGESA